ncbi:MAG TPA: PQQ-binding-like beta-propeller repeat protein [Ktedonobacteraceae bacterium]
MLTSLHGKVNVVRSLLVCLVGLTLFLSTSLIAHATSSLSLSPPYGPPSAGVWVSGSGFVRGEAISISFDAMYLAATKANLQGAFSKNITIPGSASPGKHIVEADGIDSGRVAQGTFYVQTGWSMFGYDPLHTHVSPSGFSPSQVGQIDNSWTYTTGGPVRSSAAAVNGVLYVGSNDGNLYALTLTGSPPPSAVTKLWSFATGAPVSATPVVADGVVYIGSDNPATHGGMFALNAATGAVLWHDDTDRVVSSPTLVNGALYFTTRAGYLWAVNASNGTVYWQAVAPNFQGVDGSPGPSPAVANGSVYVSTDNGYSGSNDLFAFDASSGVVRWSASCGCYGSSPAVVNGVVYTGGLNGSIHAFNATTGSLLWSYATAGQIESSPAVANGVVYIGSDDGNLYALNATTGALLWSYATGSTIVASPTVANGVVYTSTTDGHIYLLDATQGGKLLRNFILGSSIYSSPIVGSFPGAFVVGADNNRVYMFYSALIVP